MNIYEKWYHGNMDVLAMHIKVSVAKYALGMEKGSNLETWRNWRAIARL